ncbi:hypothetical protein MTO96_005253 [Rhipicephalus appendiculatus]
MGSRSPPKAPGNSGRIERQGDDAESKRPTRHNHRAFGRGSGSQLPAFARDAFLDQRTKLFAGWKTARCFSAYKAKYCIGKQEAAP